MLLQTTANGTTGPGIVVTSGAGNIDINSVIGWTTDASLTIDAYHNIDVGAEIVVRGAGTLNLDYNDEATDGTLQFMTGGHAVFLDYGSSPAPGSLNINGSSYTIVGNVASLGSAIALDPAGDFALAANYDASTDGTYASSPIATSFTGRFEGLGNKISNLTVTDALDSNVGLFSEIGTGGTVRDLLLVNADVSGTSNSGSVGALAAVNYGTIDNVGVTGTVTGGFEESVGGLVGGQFPAGSIFNSDALDSVTSGYGSNTGGLVGEGQGSIVDSYAEGKVVAGYNSDIGGLEGFDNGSVTSSHASGTVNGGYTSQVGGLVGYGGGSGIVSSYATGATTGGYQSNVGGLVGLSVETISGVYATGSVTAGYSSTVGGLVGSNGGAIMNAYARGSETSVAVSDLGGLIGINSGTVSDAYSTGKQTDSGGTIGGLIGVDTSASGSLTDTYWVFRPSSVSNSADGAGNEPNDTGITGLYMKQLTAALPAGFDPSIWAESGTINFGLPYLLASTPGASCPRTGRFKLALRSIGSAAARPGVPSFVYCRSGPALACSAGKRIAHEA